LAGSTGPPVKRDHNVPVILFPPFSSHGFWCGSSDTTVDKFNKTKKHGSVFVDIPAGPGPAVTTGGS